MVVVVVEVLVTAADDEEVDLVEVGIDGVGFGFTR